MKIGIIAEGREDQLVIRNILKGLGFDNIETLFIRPELATDDTDKATNNQKTIGTLQGIKNACQANTDLQLFFDLEEDNKLIVIHLDTAELENENNKSLEFSKPNKTDNPNYTTELVSSVSLLIDGWLTNPYPKQIIHAIAVEEIEAWLLTQFQNTDTSKSANPKNKWFDMFAYSKFKSNSDYNDYSQVFKKPKQLNKYAEYNQSLLAFINEARNLINHHQQP
jgi:hypothetical protein